jgi:hypothetical protein
MQSTVQVSFFMPFLTDISELPDESLDYLTFGSEFIMHCASVIEKKTARLLSLRSVPVVLSWGQMKQDSSSARIFV